VNDAIVRLIVDFAHTLGLTATAEGLENEQQVDSLRVMRCDLAQVSISRNRYPARQRGSSWRLILHGECLNERSP
jgi:EAL domain-containing protein (putative c-di-GMP-specific phosphodiesterase class I)